MKLFINLLILLMLFGAGLVVVLEYDAADSETERREDTREAVREIQRVLLLESALHENSQATRSYPHSIKPEWFSGPLPRNEMVDSNRPWMEIADVAERGLDHPPDRVASTRDTAMFWYNPDRGIVRARVSSGGTDAELLAAYNAVNGAAVADIFVSAATRR